MRFSRYSVKKLNRLSAYSKIWCMGCGKRFYEMLETYREEIFVARIEKVLDNNSSLWGREEKIGPRTVTISGAEALEECSEQRILLIITSDRYKEIYRGIAVTLKANNIEWTVYPDCYHIYSELIMKLCAKLPLKKQLLFYAGAEPHENADEIARYIQSTPAIHYKVVYVDDGARRKDWIVHINRDALRRQSGIKEIIRYCYYYATSRYLFYENEPLYKARDDQILVYLNHGTVPLKQVSDVLRQPEEVDCAVCPSEGCAKIYEEQYGIPESKQIYMMPARVNALFRKRGELGKQKKTKDIILWLPTFRQLEGTSRTDSARANPLEIICSEEKLAELNSVLERNSQILLVKNHPREKNKVKLSGQYSAIRLLTDDGLRQNGMSLQDLLAWTTALLTDYSGIAFEYMLLERPIGYVIWDMEDYTRGFAVEAPLDYMPGEKISTFDQLLRFVNDVHQGIDPYAVQRSRLVKLLFGEKAYRDGAKMLVDAIVRGVI